MKWWDTVRWYARLPVHRQPLPWWTDLSEFEDWLNLHTPRRWRYESRHAESDHAILFKHESDLVLFRLAFSEELARKRTRGIIVPNGMIWQRRFPICLYRTIPEVMDRKRLTKR